MLRLKNVCQKIFLFLAGNMSFYKYPYNVACSVGGPFNQTLGSDALAIYKLTKLQT